MIIITINLYYCILQLGRATKKSCKLCLLFLLGFLCSNVSAKVEIIDLGTLGGEQSIAFAINDYDQVVGTSWTASGEASDFLYANGQMVDLAQFNLFGAEAINNSGQITGTSHATDSRYYAARYDSQRDRGNAITILGYLGGVAANGFTGVSLAINSSGQAVGYSYNPDMMSHAFVYENGVMHDINFFSQDNSVAFDINDYGAVVGFSGPNAFLYEAGVLQYLIPFNSTESSARSINNSGEIVGQYLIADHTAFHAFLYSNGTFTDIGVENSAQTIAYDINEAGTVVGASWRVRDQSCRECQPYPHAFIYENGAMTDLNAMLPPGSQWLLNVAFAINNAGHIVGYGLIDGQYHAFMLKRDAEIGARTQPESLQAAPRSTSAKMRSSVK